MNVAVRRPMSVDEFLAWEERQPLRHEFDGFQTRAMTGGTIAHALIQSNLVRALGNRLAGRQCQAFGSDLKIRLAHSIRYPDASVICTPIDLTATWTTSPTIVFEILSPSTTHEDIVIKNAEYAAAESIMRYVILEQMQAGALVFSRKNGEWAAETVAGIDAVLALPEVGIEVPIAEIYAGALVAGEGDASDGEVAQPP